MNDYLIEEAKRMAYGSTQKMLEEKPLPKINSLKDVNSQREEERELEKIAPLTSYPELDEIIKGFVPGHLYTMTGDTNVGKTSVACNFAVGVAFQMKRVLYIALEPENMVIEYIASVYHDKRFDELTKDDYDFEGLPIDVMGKKGLDSIDKLIEVIDVHDRYDLIIVDHIGYFINSQNNWLQQQSNAVKQLVGLAKKNRCAIMLIAHLRKRAKNEKKNYTPTSADISGSGAFSQDSTEVLIVTRTLKSDEDDEMQYSNFGKLYVTKTKMGGGGVMNLIFSERKARIKSEAQVLKK